MVLIRDVVQQAIATGYVTVSVEERLRQLLSTKYDFTGSSYGWQNSARVVSVKTLSGAWQ